MSNLNPNKINMVYAAADITLMKSNASSTGGKIPSTAILTEDERAKSGLDIDVINKIFVEDTLNELNANGASIMSAWFNIQNVANDFTFFEQSDDIISIYENIVLRLRDAQRIAGREAFAACLVAYGLYKSAAEAGVPGAQESYNKLKVRFEKLNVGAPPQTTP